MWWNPRHSEMLAGYYQFTGKWEGEPDNQCQLYMHRNDLIEVLCCNLQIIK